MTRNRYLPLAVALVGLLGCTGASEEAPTPDSAASVGLHLGAARPLPRSDRGFERRGEGFFGGAGRDEVRVGEAGDIHFPTASAAPDDEPVFQTLEVGREGATSPRKSRVFAALHRLEASFGAARETLELMDEGVSQRWHFANRPPGRGSLVVRVLFRGLEPAGESEDALIFRRPGTDQRFRYGRATWLDAAGSRVALDTVVHDGRIEITVPAEVVDGAIYPAQIDPLIGPELPVDLPVPTSDVFGQGSFRVAAGGGVHMVAWGQVETGNAEVLVARVATDGTLLDPGGVRVGTGSEHQWVGDLAWDGTNFILVWIDESSSPYKAFGARIAPDGTVLDPGGVQLTTDLGRTDTVRLAYAAGTRLLVWTRTTGSPSGREDLYTSPMTADLVLANPDGNLLHAGPSSTLHPAVGWDGSSFLIAYVGGSYPVYDLQVAHVAPDGSTGPAGNVQLLTALETYLYPCVGGDGTNGIVAWQSYAAGLGRAELVALRISPTTVPLDISPIAFPASAAHQGFCSVEYDGSNYGVFWLEFPSSAPEEIRSIRMASDGSFVDGVSSPIYSHEDVTGGPAVDSTGAGYAIAWGERGTVSADGRVDITSSTTDPLDSAAPLVVIGENSQAEPRIATDGAGYFVVWPDEREDDTYRVIYGARLDSDGNTLDPMAIRLSASDRRVNVPNVAWDGSAYLVTWFDVTGDAVYARRVGPDGTLLDPVGSEIHISAANMGEWPHVVGRPGGGWLVGYRDGTARKLMSTLVDPDGTVLSPSGVELFDGGGSYVTLYDMETNGTDFLLVFHHSNGNALHYIRVGADGLPVGSSVTFRTNPGVTHLYAAPTVAWNGAQYLLAWADDAGTHEIRGARVAGDGTLLDPLHGYVLHADVRWLDRPRVASDGNVFLAAWSAEVDDIEALLVGPDGSPSLTTDVVSAVPTENIRADIASPGAGRFAIVYQRIAESGSTRVFVRVVSVGGCLDDADCPGAYCVDGVCCDTSCGGGVEDCQACSQIQGAAVDGTCGPLVVDRAWRVECRASTGSCDPVEVCGAGSTACPADQHVADGAACDDGIICNGADECVGGSCMNVEMTLGCDDGDACTADSCAEQGGCDHAPIPGCCDADLGCGDGDACTLDQCSGVGGSCSNVPIPMCCAADADCDDGNVCTTNSCNAATERCVAEGVPGCCASDLDCDDGDVCTTESCSPSTGTCTISLRPDCCQSAADCDDVDACTADACPVPGGSCAHTPVAGCCLTDLDCDDGDACTADGCPSPGGSCENAPIADCCHSPTDCDDGDLCTADLCPFDGGQCTHQPLADCCLLDADCEDGDACTADTCPVAGGSCMFMSSSDCCAGDVDCDDGDLCTTDTCPLEGGECSHAPVPGCCNLDTECDDGDACTADRCTIAGGFCLNDVIEGCCDADGDCDDGDACTVDTCDTAALECTHDIASECLDAGTTPVRAGGGCGCSTPGRIGAYPPFTGWVALALFVYACRRRRRA